MPARLISAREQLLARQRRDHGPELGPTVAARQREPNRFEVAADRLQLAQDPARIDAAFDELAEPLERLRRIDLNVLRLEHLLRVLTRFAQVARAAKDGRDRDGNADTRGEIFVGERGER